MQRIGISANWKSVAAIVRNAKTNSEGEDFKKRLERNEDLIRRYIKHEPIYVEKVFPVRGMVELTEVKQTYVMGSLSAAKQLYRFEIALLKGKSPIEWLSDASFHTNRKYAYTCYELLPSPSKVIFEWAVSNLCRCLYLGWHTRAEQLTHLIADAYRRKHLLGVKETRGESVYNWFLRIAFDHYGIEFTDWAEDAYTLVKTPDHGDRSPKFGDQIEPVLNFMYDIWDKPDLSGDTELILNFCDYYTHRCKVKDWYEFRSDWVEMRFPFLILAWFKLRQMRGLPIPEIDHPLMQTNPAAHFVPEQPYPEDEVMDKAIARLKAEELPNLVLV